MIPQLKNYYILQLIKYWWDAVYLKMSERSDSLNIQFSIFDSQFSGGPG